MQVSVDVDLGDYLATSICNIDRLGRIRTCIRIKPPIVGYAGHIRLGAKFVSRYEVRYCMRLFADVIRWGMGVNQCGEYLAYPCIVRVTSAEVIRFGASILGLSSALCIWRA